VVWLVTDMASRFWEFCERRLLDSANLDELCSRKSFCLARKRRMFEDTDSTESSSTKDELLRVERVRGGGIVSCSFSLTLSFILIVRTPVRTPVARVESFH
jgi:hypothetical protein